MRLQRRFVCYCIALLSGFSAGLARSEVNDAADLSLVTGFVNGSVTKQQIDGSRRTFQMGGIPLGAALNRNLSANWTGALSGHILLDIVNRQVIRQGIGGSMSYHLLGGARRLSLPGDMVSISTSNSYNFSLLGRVNLQNYAASDPERPTNNIAGGLWEIATGLEYRKDFSESSAYGVAMLLSIATMPASVQRLSSKTSELLLFWRF